jgi:DNA-directed RNA polymerase II subunit RPB7
VVSLAVDSGFFCMAGPLRVFVSRFMMPDDVDEFQNENHTWVSQDKEVEIRAGCGVRLRIMGVSIDANAISAVGTIKDDHLGLISTVDAI